MLAQAPDGRNVFLRGALPGERVTAKIAADHRSYLWADTVSVLLASDQRTAGIWPEASDLGVGGVELGHATPDLQRQWKSQVLNEQIARLGGPELQAQIAEFAPGGLVVDPAPSDSPLGPSDKARDLGSSGRRTRIQLVAAKDGRLGMYAFRSHDVIPLDRVPVAVKPINDLTALNSGIVKGPWKGKWKPGTKVSIEAPNASPAVVVTPRGVFRFGPGANTGQQVGDVSRWSVEAAGRVHTFEVRPGGFWQTHVDAPFVLVSAVLEAAEAELGQTIVELYSGAGLFTRFLADEVGSDGKILSLEVDKRAVADAARNLAEPVDQGRVDLYEGMVDAQAIRDLEEATGGMIDTIVLDPPRKGAGADVVDAISKTAAKRVVLVSCDPAAGARDLKCFVEGGFKVVGLRAWDLFPHTHHFEMVAALVR